ncbi:hypothetical protein BFC18_10350 [Alteromonas confluentis]|uniref:DUF2252 domain-containing protein n=2 Tax=Alteromonas confluentis TaxID=1656094 RepID=A0A1E7ZBE8_9ALTE|nr:hypothetical protein BFC18_10350 [Alteromonas confluentis]
MTENSFTGLSPRHQFVDTHILRIDGRSPDPLLIKHAKMAQSPFTFYRGSAQLFYADWKAGNVQVDAALLSLPLTCVVGDCHMSNFGFMTEEGSHGDIIIFSPNDFDDACVGHAGWDIVRFLVSLELAREHCEGVRSGKYESAKQATNKAVIDSEHVELAMDAFLDGYLTVCERVADDPTALYDAVEDIMPGTRLHKFYNKACARAAGGEEFLTKSALAKAVQMRDDGLAFRKNSDKFTPLAPHYYTAVKQAFAPYMDDDVIDIVQRNHAGTGSNNLDRFYFLVGPAKPHNEATFSRCHIVEVKQQREAAPLFYYPDLSPVNRLNPAHLTARCQRKMKRRPDLLLDEAEWSDKHWLIRSRHHARVGINPEDICMGNRSIDGGFVDFAQVCGEALAFAHCRGDRRSVEFELAALSVLETTRDALRRISLEYAEQVKSDHADWVAYFRGQRSATC